VPRVNPSKRAVNRFRHWIASPFTVISLLALIAGVSIVFFGFIYTYAEFDLKAFIAENYSNFGIELISIGFTVLVVDGLHRHHDERDRKRELIVQMGSPDRDFAIEAVRILRLKGWLEDGTLEGMSLAQANLQGAKLYKADLERADLSEANLQQVALYGVDLRGANLEAADLEEATYIQNALFDEDTILPDGSNWTPDRDLRQFTHPDEWDDVQHVYHPERAERI
jgi:hypothetical protein